MLELYHAFATFLMEYGTVLTNMVGPHRFQNVYDVFKLLTTGRQLLAQSCSLSLLINHTFEKIIIGCLALSNDLALAQTFRKAISITI